ncbi:nuclear factor NF2 [Besnoitia besnoiti]|uniref:Nuclear factor NF2 n=1 Tax=Besnoitia besnoiti TaxID=94643 RepID=A0A2A9MGH3_BESBE|nr:nuclear factor NF2 [Besnoitia besnoiti]PFH34697.1 nuclear factor NF2 [Besnoitia besnoiti]
MNESRLRQEIRRLVTEQRQLNRRLQQQRRPRGELFSFSDEKKPEENGVAEAPAAAAPSQQSAPDATSPSTLAGESQSGLGKRPLVRERPTYSFDGEDFQVEKRPKLAAPDEKTATRNRRMFGALAGHLRRAQRQLLQEQTTDLAHKQKQQEERVAQKLAMSQKNIAKIARLEWEKRRQQEQLRLEEVSNELANKENELMRLHLVKHYRNMEVFIGTEAQPTLFWLPAKWDDTTRRLQEQTKLWIRTKIEHIQETDYTYRPQGGVAEGEGAAPASKEEEGRRPESAKTEDGGRSAEDEDAGAVETGKEERADGDEDGKEKAAEKKI